MAGSRQAKDTEVDGVRYRSGFEASVARDLAKRGVPFEYESTQLLYEVPRSYVVDFDLPGGDREKVSGFQSARKIHVEVKGWLTREDRQKLREVKRANPELDIRIVFQRANAKISKAKRAMTYGRWAERHGFPWAEGKVPESWLLGEE